MRLASRPAATRATLRAIPWLLVPALALLACATARPATRSAPVSGPAAAVAALAAGPRDAGRPEQVLLISVAGLTPAHYLGAEAAREWPLLHALAAGGAAAERVRAVVPAAAQPAHVTLVSGREPARHGVLADRRLGERGLRTGRSWHASQVQGPTLWDAAATGGLPVAALDWPATSGAAIPLLLPQVEPERRGESWLGLLAGGATPWLHELAMRAPAEAAAPGAVRDHFLVDAACALFAGAAPPRLLLLRLTGSEAALARHGPGSAEARAAFAAVDAELGRLVGCLERDGRLAASAFVVAGDRAFRAAHTELHPNAVLAATGLVKPQKSWRALARSNGGSAFVYARDAEAAIAARRALEAEALRTRAFRVVGAEEMIEFGADPEAWFGLAAEPGWWFGNASGPPRQRASRLRGVAGYLEADGPTPGLVVFGRGVRRGVRLPRVAQTDVAPTLARLLGVELAPGDGRVLVGALEAAGPVVGGTR